MYGAIETNGLLDPSAYHAGVDHAERVTLDDPRIVKIERLRLLTDPGFPMIDVSYCHARLADGRIVSVDLDITQFRKSHYKAQLIDLCKRAGRYGVGLGIFDAISMVR